MVQSRAGVRPGFHIDVYAPFPALPKSAKRDQVTSDMRIGGAGLMVLLDARWTDWLLCESRLLSITCKGDGHKV